VQLLRAREALAAFPVERRRLVRILAVAQVHELGRAQAQIGRQGAGGIQLSQARGEWRIVIRVVRKAFSPGASGVSSGQPVFPHSPRGGVIIFRRHHHRDILVILGRRADQGWSPISGCSR